MTTVIACALAEQGHDVYILSANHGLSTFFPIYSTVKLYSLHMERHSANLSDWRVWPSLRSFVKTHSIERFVDVDTVHSWYSIPATWGTSTRVITWEHFHLFINVGDAFQRFRRSLGRRMAMRWAYRVVTLTERDRQQYLLHFPSSTSVVAVPNPITIELAQPASLNAKVVIAVGRLVPEKGFDLLLQAWAQVSRSGLPWRLRIVGSGAEAKILQQQALLLGVQESVDFVPNTPDMISEYQRAGLYVCSSRFEGFGLVLVEAKSFGLPIVSFDCACGPSDIVREGVDGLLVPAEDVDALASALVRLMGNDDERHLMGRRAIEDDRFELTKIVKTWERVLA